MTGFMSRTFSMLFLLVVACVNVCAQDKSLCLSDGKPIHVADPCVFKSGNVYYLTGTSTADKGFEYYTSTDLKNWTRRGMLYEPKGEAYVGANCFWAPEVRMYKGRYYLTFSCYSPKYKSLITCLAVSDKPEGEYKDIYVLGLIRSTRLSIAIYLWMMTASHIFITATIMLRTQWQLVKSMRQNSRKI